MKAEFGVSIWKSTWNEILIEVLEYNNAQSSSPKMIFASMLYSLQKIQFVLWQSAVKFRFTLKILSCWICGANEFVISWYVESASRKFYYATFFGFLQSSLFTCKHLPQLFVKFKTMRYNSSLIPSIDVCTPTISSFLTFARICI